MPALPIAALLALVTIYLINQGSGAKTPPAALGASGGGTPPSPSGDAFTPSTEEYVDGNKVPWTLTNAKPDVWSARVARDPSGYPGYERAWDESVAAIWQPTRTTRADLVNYIDALLVKGTKLEISPDIEKGTKAGLDDANASIQAYKDSFTGYHVKPVYPRWQSSASSAWRDAYNAEFKRQIYRWGYDIVDGFIRKAAA